MCKALLCVLQGDASSTGTLSTLNDKHVNLKGREKINSVAFILDYSLLDNCLSKGNVFKIYFPSAWRTELCHSATYCFQWRKFFCMNIAWDSWS